MVRHADLEMIVVKEDVCTHGSLEGTLHREAQGQSGGRRGERTVWPRAFKGFCRKEWTMQGRCAK